MSQRLYIPFQQLFTNLGAIGAGWKIATYETGTTTPKATYSDTGLTIANANPASGATTGNQVADANGRLGNMYISNAALYKVILLDNNGDVIQTVDPVDPQTTSLNIFSPIPEAFWGTTSGTSTAYTLDSNVDISAIGYQDTQIFQLSFHTTCGASPTLDIDGLGALNLKKYTGQGTKVALQAADVTTQTYSARNDGTDIVILNPEAPYLNLRNATVTGPTLQVFTSGSGTYTTPTYCKTLHIKMIGGGGGGGGSTAGTPGVGTTGGTTSFNSITVIGGSGGSVTNTGGSGGSGGSGTATLRVSGFSGGLAYRSGAGADTQWCGQGADAFMGLGQGGYSIPNANGAAGQGYGSGGSGAIQNIANNGGGGGSGEYAELIINAPAASYSYTVGSGGAGGTASGGTPFTGGAGAPGLIQVYEYYV